MYDVAKKRGPLFQSCMLKSPWPWPVLQPKSPEKNIPKSGWVHFFRTRHPWNNTSSSSICSNRYHGALPPTHTAVDGSFKYPSMPLIPINNVNSWRHVTVSLYLCPTWYRVLRPSTAIHYTWYCDYIVSNIDILLAILTYCCESN